MSFCEECGAQVASAVAPFSKLSEPLRKIVNAARPKYLKAYDVGTGVKQRQPRVYFNNTGKVIKALHSK